jgi:hypothetical protein
VKSETSESSSDNLVSVINTQTEQKYGCKVPPPKSSPCLDQECTVESDKGTCFVHPRKGQVLAHLLPMIDDRLVGDVTLAVAAERLRAPGAGEPLLPSPESHPVLRLLCSVCVALDQKGGVQVQGGRLLPDSAPPEEADGAAPEEPDLEGKGRFEYCWNCLYTSKNLKTNQI